MDRFKGKIGEAIRHSKIAPGIASPLNWHDALSWVHDPPATLFLDERRFDNSESNDHVERVKLHAVDGAYSLGRGMEQQARVWRK